MKYLLLLGSALALGPLSTAALAASVENLAIVSNGDVIGSVVAAIDGNRVDVDYKVSNNGRGPSHHESIILGPGSIPLKWSVVGTSLMGGDVDEQFTWNSGRATWRSQADEGERSLTRPTLYVLADDSPWALYIYARAALASPLRSVETIPAGRLTISEVRDYTVGTGKRAVKTTIYRLDGIELDPAYVLLDQKGRLFATLGREAAIRTGYEAEAPALQALGQQIEAIRIADISARVTHRFDTPIRIRNVHVFDPVTKTRGPLSTVIVMRDRIAGVILNSNEPTPNDQVDIDGEGGTVYPGLHDMHSHTTLTSGLYYLAAGVTATRDMGNDNPFLLDFMPKVDRGEIAGPRIIADGFIEGRSPYSARFGFVIDSIPAGREAVRWYADRGYAEVKFYNSLNPEFVKPLADEAKRLGMGVTGHVPAFSTPDRVIGDGYNSIAHINQLVLGWLLEPGEDTRTPLRLTAMARTKDLDLNSRRVQQTVNSMKADDVALDTTTVILERLMLSRTRQVSDGDAAYLDHLPIGYQRYRKRTFVPLKNAADDEAYRLSFAKLIDVMRMLHEAGVRLLPGTDDATGFTVQREIELYAKAMSNSDALYAATLGSEEYFKNTVNAGTIQRGKLAELVLVAGDPTKDIAAIRAPRMVMKGGAVYFPEEIYRELQIQPFSKSPTIRPATKASPKLNGAGQGGAFDAHDPFEH